MLRSAPLLRRDALLIRGPSTWWWVPDLRSTASRCTASGTRASIAEIFDHLPCHLRNGIASRCAL